jgi:hypothetical protein
MSMFDNMNINENKKTKKQFTKKNTKIAYNMNM